MDPASSDEDLVRRLSRGDAVALRQLMDRYKGPLHGYLCRLLASPQDAEDLLQDTFVRVLRHAARFDAKRTFRPWLYSIATNLARNTFRSRSYRDAVPLDRDDDDGAGLAAQLAGRGERPGDAIERDEAAKQVRAAVDVLPEKGRAAVVLFYYQGLSYDEIAEALDIPVGTVKSRIHNAMARLAQALNPDRGPRVTQEEPS